jgi:hypothetical protein
VLVLRRADALPLRAGREMCRVRLVRRALPVLPGPDAMTPTSDLLCRLVEAATGSAPLEVEFIADADPRRGWMVRAWLGERTIRDYRLYVTKLVPGVAAEALHEWLVEDAFDRWPPADIRGGIRRCRCSPRTSGDETLESS